MLFFFIKTHARRRNKWLESWPSMFKKALRREPSSDGRKGNPHEKLHIRLREMFGFPPQMNSSKALFETQERRKFCMEQPCGHLPH